jgi:hypothetical protein
MTIGTNWTGFADNQANIDAGRLEVLFANRADVTLTYTGDAITAASVAKGNVYRAGVLSDDTMINREGDLQQNINQSISTNITRKRTIETVIAQKVTQLGIDEIESSELVVFVVDPDLILLKNATLASRVAGTLVTKYVIDHVWFKAVQPIKFNEAQNTTLSCEQMGLSSGSKYLGEDLTITLS